MRICLVRHGIAVERGTRGFEDDDTRPLTPRGRERMREAAAGLAVLFTPQLIFTSPLLRATQTAEILAATYRLSHPIELAALADPDVAALPGYLRDVDAGSVMLVGHEPYLSETLSLLVAGDPARARAILKKGGAALVSSDGDPDPGSCVLEWLIQPGALRGIGTAAHS